MCGSILREVERAGKRKCVAAYLERLREKQKKVCSSILGEVERAEKRKFVAGYLGKFSKHQRESVWQYT